jgi:hypothetical protein
MNAEKLATVKKIPYVRCCQRRAQKVLHEKGVAFSLDGKLRQRVLEAYAEHLQSEK